MVNQVNHHHLPIGYLQKLDSSQATEPLVFNEPTTLTNSKSNLPESLTFQAGTLPKYLGKQQTVKFIHLPHINYVTQQSNTQL